MNTSRSWRSIWLVAGSALFVSGVAVSFVIIFGLHKSVADIQQSNAMLNRIMSLEQKLGSVEEAKRILDSLDSNAPRDLDDIIRTSGLESKIVDSGTSVASLGDGWSVITREIALSDILLEDLEQFIVTSRASVPPWVIAEISLRSSPFESGRARVTLKLQALRSKSR